MAQRQIIDCHHHLGPDPDYPDRLVEQCARLGIVKVVVAAAPEHRRSGSNRQALAAAERHPDLIVPFAGVDMERDRPETIADYKARGFRGLKFIAPMRRYNHPSYLPLYRAAGDLGLPGLFHLGIVANRDPWTDADSSLMRPIFLDHIARRHPSWKILGAHLGNPWHEEATMACRWNPNLFFDLSGSTLKKKKPAFLGELLWWRKDTYYRSPDGTEAWQKIVFGSDVVAEDIHDVVGDYERLLSALNLPEERWRDVFYNSAARLLGMAT